jgi:hypothetical protein
MAAHRGSRLWELFLDDTRVVKVAFGVPDSMLAHFRMGWPLPVQVDAL